ncbi:MAG TPA: hypothetical protein GX707_14355 [Epulopiscium sp.]|nr:hypothetical protein [Candidatus Epulonipiscium sp.]
MPGMPVIIPAPTTYKALKERITDQNGYSCMDWYLCFKEIENKIENGCEN